MNRLTLLFSLTFLVLSQFVSAQVGEDILIDKVVAVVGNKPILHSDIEAQYAQYRMQGTITGGEQQVKCQILESLLLQKMLLNQADLDSIVITKSQIDNEMDRRLRYFISQIGSQEKLEEYYKKSISEIKEEMRTVIEEQMLTEEAQNEIMRNVVITPSEVRSMFKKLPVDSVPMVNTKVQVLEIVKKPEVSIEQKIEIKEKLRKLRQRIIDGESFKTMAILYSEDPGSAKNGGELGFYGRGELYPEFETVAFRLKKGDISEIVETKAGYHIIELIERRGEFVNARHILLMPKVSPIDLANAAAELDTVVMLIKSDSLTFEQAVEKYSDSEDKNNDGLMINPYTNSADWELDQLDPKALFVVDKMSVGEISRPVLFQTPEGADAYRVLMLKKKTRPHRANMEEDYDIIQKWALEVKKTEVMNSWVEDHVEDTFIRIDDDYMSCGFINKWITK